MVCTLSSSSSGTADAMVCSFASPEGSIITAEAHQLVVVDGVAAPAAWWQQQQLLEAMYRLVKAGERVKALGGQGEPCSRPRAEMYVTTHVAVAHHHAGLHKRVSASCVLRSQCCTARWRGGRNRMPCRFECLHSFQYLLELPSWLAASGSVEQGCHTQSGVLLAATKLQDLAPIIAF
jgi:hypothetical protein